LLDENLRLIGLHHAFGRRRTAGADVERPVNEAVRASAILAAVAKSIPQLFKSPDASGKGNNVPPPAGRKAAASRPISPAAALAAAAAAVPASSASTEIAEAGAAQERNSVFISYARDDQGKHRWRERLRTFLSAFKAELDVWDDSRIETGAEWRSEIDIALKRARVAVLLVGPSFLGSDFINKNELPPLLNAAADQGVTILPLITNHCSYEKTELGRHQAFNEPNKPLEALSRPAQNGWLRKFADKIDDAFRSSKA